MRSFIVAARIVATSLLGGAALAVHLLAVLCALALAATQSAGTQEAEWALHSTVLAVPLWLPGLWVALQLRRAWPALGPEDEGARWARLSGANRALVRAGAFTGAVVALILLEAALGVALGVAMRPFAHPEMRDAVVLRPVSATGALVTRGATERFALPAHTGPASLRLEPRYRFTGVGSRAGIRLSIHAEEAGNRRSLGQVHLRDFGSTAELEARLEGESLLVIERTSGSGPSVSFAAGRVLVSDAAGTSPELAGARLALLHTGWALTLLLIAFASSAFLSARVQRIVLVGVAPIVAVLPSVPLADAGHALRLGMIVSVHAPGALAVALAAAMLVLGSLPLPRGER